MRKEAINMDTQNYEITAWRDSKVEQPPPDKIVLMWYVATDNISAWAIVGKWQDRIVRKPDYWAWIHTPRI